jgi:hypothetical protein
MSTVDMSAYDRLQYLFKLQNLQNLNCYYLFTLISCITIVVSFIVVRGLTRV